MPDRLTPYLRATLKIGDYRRLDPDICSVITMVVDWRQIQGRSTRSTNQREIY